MSKKMGRPSIDFKWEVFDALMQFKVTLAFCADYMDISEDLIEKRIKQKCGLTYSEYNKLKMQRTGLKLQQQAIEMALKGNTTMMIFALKNIAGWKDKIDEPIGDEFEQMHPLIPS